MNQNKNTTYCYNHQVPKMESQLNTGVSVFNILNDSKIIVEQNYKSRKNSFSSFINSRNQYLNKLKNIGDNWISGYSKEPTGESIELSKDLLNHIDIWYTNKGYKDYIYPKIIMSPTPKGGIAMELEFYPNLRGFVTIFNETINLEVERDGFFSEQEADKDNIANILLNLYNRNERGYYSER